MQYNGSFCKVANRTSAIFAFLWVNEAQSGRGAQNRRDGGRHLSLLHMSGTPNLPCVCLNNASSASYWYADTIRIRKKLQVTGAGCL